MRSSVILIDSLTHLINILVLISECWVVTMKFWRLHHLIFKEVIWFTSDTSDLRESVWWWLGWYILWISMDDYINFVVDCPLYIASVQYKLDSTSKVYIAIWSIPAWWFFWYCLLCYSNYTLSNVRRLCYLSTQISSLQITV